MLFKPASEVVFYGYQNEYRLAASAAEYAKKLLWKIFEGSAQLGQSNPDQLDRIAQAVGKPELTASADFANDLFLFLREREREIKIDGVNHRIGDVCLNTAIFIGSPVIQFLARVIGLARTHMYIPSTEQIKIADIISLGHMSCVLPRGLGWQELAQGMAKNRNFPLIASVAGEKDWFNVEAADWQDTVYDKLKDNDTEINLRTEASGLSSPCFGFGTHGFALWQRIAQGHRPDGAKNCPNCDRLMQKVFLVDPGDDEYRCDHCNREKPYLGVEQDGKVVCSKHGCWMYRSRQTFDPYVCPECMKGV